MRSLTIRVYVLAAAIGLGGCFTGPAPDATTVGSSSQATMVLSPPTLAFNSSAGSTPAPQTVTVSNAGAGTLAPPVTSTTYLGQEKDWLNVTVSGSAAPYTITVQPNIVGIPARPNPNLASVAVDCPGASNTPLAIAVQLVVQ